ncbi:MAG: SulP family inorganic anion transporter [Flavobacteriales bacterium]|nr:SulP family inorganic anion transporter [Flavobacteriales bacterium]
MSNRSLFSHWRQDLPASFVVFLVAVPLCLGIALASGAPPVAGLIAGVIGGIAVGFASGSAVGVSGPAAGLAALVAVAIVELGSYEAFLAAVVLAGVIQVVLGFLGAGVIAYYFPNSVIKGMLAGIGIIIFLKQIPHAFGYDKDFEGDLAFIQPDHENTFSELMHMVGYITPGAIMITAVCLAILLVWETPMIRRSRSLSLVPGPLLAVIAGIVLGVFQSGFGDHGVASEHFVDLPDLSKGLDAFSFPDHRALLNWRVWLTAGTIALVASLETLLCVEATDKLDPEKHITPTDRELRAQGLGNALSGLFGGLPVTQVIVRSSANLQSGVKSKLSAILHGVWILLCVILIPGIMELIPLASLAAILFVVGYKLAKPALFKEMWSKGWRQFVPFMITILGVVFIDLLKGVMLGMVVGIIMILRNNFLTPFSVKDQDGKSGGPVKMELGQAVTFFNKASIQKTLASLPSGTHVIVDASKTVDLDPDVLEIIQEEMIRAKDQGIKIELIGESVPVKVNTDLLGAVIEQNNGSERS